MLPASGAVELQSIFDATEIQPWDGSKYEVVKKLQDAPRNQGTVLLMREPSGGQQWAVKQMPNSWIRESHKEFLASKPFETEMPWQDIGFIRYLNKLRYPYTCSLVGVFKDGKNTYVKSSFATEGDLFSWCAGGPVPGEEREKFLRPVVVQLLQGIQLLHEISMVHRDISLENILLSREDGDPRNPLSVKIIDFGMASTVRFFRNSVRGKCSYQSPESHKPGEYDGFLADTFSLGVALYAIFFRDYPWMATKPGGCQCFEFVQEHGLRAFMAERMVRDDGQRRLSDVVSEPVMQLLEGLLAHNPKDRLTLGEKNGAQRKSVWDMPWLAGIDQSRIAPTHMKLKL